jgi:hypothetical protein
LKLVTAMAIKLALQAAPLARLVAALLGATARSALVAALLVWVVSFVVGDLLILPPAAAALAAGADLVLSGALLMMLLHGGPSWNPFWIALAVAVAEFLLHRAMLARGAVRERAARL